MVRHPDLPEETLARLHKADVNHEGLHALTEAKLHEGFGGFLLGFDKGHAKGVQFAFALLYDKLSYEDTEMTQGDIVALLREWQETYYNRALKPKVGL